MFPELLREKVKRIERELDEVIEERDTLLTLLQSIGHERIGTRTIGKKDLENALELFYNYESVKIKKICVGSPDTATYVYPPKADPSLLLKVDIQFKEKKGGR